MVELVRRGAANIGGGKGDTADGLAMTRGSDDVVVVADDTRLPRRDAATGTGGLDAIAAARVRLDRELNEDVEALRNLRSVAHAEPTLAIKGSPLTPLPSYLDQCRLADCHPARKILVVAERILARLVARDGTVVFGLWRGERCGGDVLGLVFPDGWRCGDLGPGVLDPFKREAIDEIAFELRAEAEAPLEFYDFGNTLMDG